MGHCSGAAGGNAQKQLKLPQDTAGNTQTHIHAHNNHIHKVRNAKTGLDATSRCDSCSRRLTSKRSKQKAAKINVGRSAKFTQYLKMKKKSAKRHTLCSARLPHLKHTHTHTQRRRRKKGVLCE